MDVLIWQSSFGSDKCNNPLAVRITCQISTKYNSKYENKITHLKITFNENMLGITSCKELLNEMCIMLCPNMGTAAKEKTAPPLVEDPHRSYKNTCSFCGMTRKKQYDASH